MINLNNHMESKQTAIESLAVDEQKYPHLAAHREKASIGCINLAKYTSVCDRACLCAATALSIVRFLGGNPQKLQLLQMDSPNKHLELLDNAIPETQTNPQDWPGKTGKARPPPRRTLQKASGRPSSSGVAEQNHKDYRHNIHRIHRNTLLKKHHRTWGKWTKYDQIMVEARQF